MSFWRFFLVVISGFVLMSCANRAEGPTGGPRDSIPPVMVRSVPIEGAVNHRRKEIQVYFDENITLEKVQENVFISPPQTVQPIIRASGRLLSIALQDELLDSTTYSLFFGDAVVDLNEKNPLRNFTFSFSTGPEIDTLQVSGMLVNAQTLEPLNGVIVGLHRNLQDSAMYKEPFVRATRSDETGRFTIRNIREGSYRLYAHRDQNRDFLYQIGEGVAFHDSIVVPVVQIVERLDTIGTDSIEHVHLHRYITYLPDDLELRLFTETRRRQFLRNSERPEKFRFNLIFNDRLKEIPEIVGLNADLSASLIKQLNPGADTLMYWIREEQVFNIDTLSMVVNYLKTDSVFNLVPASDTIRLAVRRASSAARTATSVPVDAHVLAFRSNLANEMEFHHDIKFSFEQPVDSVDLSGIRLSEVQDSILTKVNYSWVPMDTIGIRYELRYVRKPKQQYELIIDSAAVRGIFGTANMQLKRSFKTKSPEDYSTLKFSMTHPADSLIIELLDPAEKIIASQIAKEGGNTFEYLKPGDYFVRVFADRNRNGMWDPGNLLERIQPEEVYYFNKKLNLRANWEVEENWDHSAPSVWLKRPDDLMKKPK